MHTYTVVDMLPNEDDEKKIIIKVFAYMWGKKTIKTFWVFLLG